MLRRIRALGRLVFRYALPLALAAACYGVGWWISESDMGGLRPYEFEAQQELQQDYAPVDLTDKIVIVEMTQTDTNALDKVRAVAVRRSHHAKLIEGLEKAKAVSVIFDLKFGDITTTDDAQFVAAVKNASRLTVGFLQTPLRTHDEHARNGARYEFNPPALLPDNLLDSVELGQAELVHTGPLSGDMALLLPDSDTKEEVENLALIGFRSYYDIRREDVHPNIAKNEIQVGRDIFSMGPDADWLIDWPRPGRDFKAILYSTALKILANGDPHKVFFHKIILVANEDDVVVPTVHGKELGTWMIAHAMNTLFQTNERKVFVTKLSYDRIWGAFLSLLICLSASSRRTILAITGVLLGLVLALFGPLAFVIGAHVMFPVVGPVLVAFIATVASLALRLLVPGLYPYLASEAFEATILFIDIKDSTPLVERLGPSGGSQVFRHTLRIARDCVMAEGGEVIRDLGDGLFTIFRAGTSADHATHALRAVSRILDVEEKITREVGQPVSFTFGIETGPLHGVPRQVHGLAIHTAARLQAACGATRYALLVGPTAYGLAKHEIQLEAVDQLRLKGVAHPVQVYTLARSVRNEIEI